MPSYLPRTWLDRLFGLCFSLLLAAIAAHVAVELIEAVWTALLVILGVGLLWRPGWRCCATGDRGW